MLLKQNVILQSVICNNLLLKQYVSESDKLHIFAIIIISILLIIRIQGVQFKAILENIFQTADIGKYLGEKLNGFDGDIIRSFEDEYVKIVRKLSLSFSTAQNCTSFNTFNDPTRYSLQRDTNLFIPLFLRNGSENETKLINDAK